MILKSWERRRRCGGLSIPTLSEREAAHNLGVPGYGVGDDWSATQHSTNTQHRSHRHREPDERLGDRRPRWRSIQSSRRMARTTKTSTGPEALFSQAHCRAHLGFLLGHLALRDWSPPDLPAPMMLDPTSQRAKRLHAHAIRALPILMQPPWSPCTYLRMSTRAQAAEPTTTPPSN